jgi:parvulin-like peptidyl-prolyl isomerase
VRVKKVGILIGLSNFFSVRAVFVASFAVLVSFLLAGCAPAPPASKVESGARKVIIFDGGGVTEGEVQDAVERLNSVVTAMSAESPKQTIQPGSPQFEAAKRQVLPQLLAFNLAKAYARENGISVSEEEVQDEIDQTKRQVAQQAEAAGRGEDPEKLFQDALGKFGFTEASFRQEVRTSLLVRKVQDDAVGDVKPTEEEIRDFYEKNKATQFTIPERRCIRHILFTPDEEEKAKEVKSELENGGDFAKLAEENSQDPGSKERGGDLGCQAQGAFAPEFGKAASEAKEGEIVGPVKTDFGFHLIEVTKIQPKEEMSLEEATPEIEERLSQQRQATGFAAWIQDQLEERNVKYLPGYNPIQPTPAGIPPGIPDEAVPEGVPGG